MARLTVFIIEDYDGAYSVAVAATTLKEACRKAHTTQREVRMYGYHQSTEKSESVVMDNPGSLYRRRYMSRGPWTFWKDADPTPSPTGS